jgi:hypothetical protein
MFVKRHPSNRLLSLAVSLILITLAILGVCPVMAGSTADSHNCCKPQSSPEPASESSDCRVKCASTAESAVTPVLLHIGFSSLEQTVLPRTVAPIPHPRAASSVTLAVDTTATQRPIYERTSALLI